VLSKCIGAMLYKVKCDMNNAIGVFDSGMGGLTVLRELKRLLPNENFIYLGDTARLPYGTKSSDTVIKYSAMNAQILVDCDIKLLVVACNTASSVALADLRNLYPNLPIIGVIEPGAQDAVKASRNETIAVLATETTIRVGGYQQAIQNLNPSVKVLTKSCSLLVALAEEGWVNNQVAKAALEEYLLPIKDSEYNCDCLVLGCTHFPVFIDLIRKIMGDEVAIINSASSTAQVVKELLTDLNIKSPLVSGDESSTQFMVTDSPNRFSEVGQGFLNSKIDINFVKLVEYKNSIVLP
jgi:glutamate racemase